MDAADHRGTAASMVMTALSIVVAIGQNVTGRDGP
jgi:hypothetical protein